MNCFHTTFMPFFVSLSIYGLCLCIQPQPPLSLRMEYNDRTTKQLAVSDTPFSSSSSSFSRVSPLLSRSAVQGPCGACKVLRRRCTESCLLAPYFPPTEPMKFINVHKIYGASNIVKCLQELPESKRADAVSSMVYEANARIRDPVYGCAGTISHLQKQLNDVQAKLAMTQAEILITQSQQQQQQKDNASFLNDRNLALDWETDHWGQI